MPSKQGNYTELENEPTSDTNNDPGPEVDLLISGKSDGGDFTKLEDESTSETDNSPGPEADPLVSGKLKSDGRDYTKLEDESTSETDNDPGPEASPLISGKLKSDGGDYTKLEDESVSETDSGPSPNPPCSGKWDVKNFSPVKKRVLFLALCIYRFLCFLPFNLPVSYLPSYNTDRGISSTWTGLIIGSISVGFAVSCLFIAPIVVNKFSTRVVLAGCAVGQGSFILLFGALHVVQDATTYQILALAARFCIGVFGGLFSVVSFAAYVAIYPKNVATCTAIGEAVLNGAVAFGPFLGGVFFAASGFIVASVIPGAVLFLSAFPAFFIPNLNSKKRREASSDGKFHWKNILDLWVLFPLWHLALAQILLGYHLPLLEPYAQKQFNASVVWAGTVLLISTGVIVVSSPLTGFLIDKYGPVRMMVASCVLLPLVYAFVGPNPLLSFVEPSKIQVTLALAFLGLVVPSACVIALPMMFQVYAARNNGSLPVLVINSLVCLYSASYPAGYFIGTAVSGILEPYASFGWSTGTLGMIFLIESAVCGLYCWGVAKMLKAGKKKLDEGNHNASNSHSQPV